MKVSEKTERTHRKISADIFSHTVVIIILDLRDFVIQVEKSLQSAKFVSCHCFWTISLLLELNKAALLTSYYRFLPPSDLSTARLKHESCRGPLQSTLV